MTSRNLAAFSSLSLPWLLAASLHAQAVSITPLPAPIPLADALRSRGVSDLSEPSLITALMSSNPEIRILAANKLAEDGAHDAIPAIETALQVEKSVNAEANIAQALWVLHDPKGVERLLTMCADPGLRTGDLLITLVILQNTQTSVSTCANTLLNAISGERDMGLLAMSLARLPFVSRDAPPDIRTRIFEVLSAFLFDTAQPFIVRQSSSQALAQIGSSDARDAIQKAITTEKNQGLRESFERDLKVIENKS